MDPLISILIPALNEEATLEQVVDSVFDVLSSEFALEFVIVDDGSSDRTPEVIEELSQRYSCLRTARHPAPQGKGSAVRTGLGLITGDIFVIQDADLEYQPSDLPALLRPILEGRADAVYGSRFTSPERAVNFFWTTLANQLLTLFANVLFNTNFTDLYTGYKAIRTDLVRDLHLDSRTFVIEAELTAKLKHAGARFYEVPIRYRARTFSEGKKIRAFDAVRAIGGLIRYRFSSLR